MLLCGTVSATVITDGTFNDSDWTTFKIPGSDSTPGENGVVAVDRLTTGGNPDAFRQTSLQFTGVGGVSNGIAALTLYTATVFDPSSGAIVSFDYSFHGMAVPGNVGNGHGVSIAARQAGNIFFGQSFAVHGINNTAWNSYSGAGVTANDFSCFLCSATLELTTSGAPIELGFVHASSTQQSIRVFRTIGMDNVLLRSNLAGAPPASPATSPPTAALMLLGLVATVRFRRGRVARAHRRAGAATTSHERRTIE